MVASRVAGPSSNLRRSVGRSASSWAWRVARSRTAWARFFAAACLDSRGGRAAASGTGALELNSSGAPGRPSSSAALLASVASRDESRAEGAEGTDEPERLAVGRVEGVAAGAPRPSAAEATDGRGVPRGLGVRTGPEEYSAGFGPRRGGTSGGEGFAATVSRVGNRFLRSSRHLRISSGSSLKLAAWRYCGGMSASSEGGTTEDEAAGRLGPGAGLCPPSRGLLGARGDCWS
jgi:hypothetical protein